MAEQDKPYVGVVWIGDEPGRRFTVTAGSVEEAQQKAEALFGTGHPMTLYNEDDAQRPRG